MKYIVVFFINVYQRYISPYKGFRCAYAALNGGDSCSEAVKKIVLEQGCFNGRQEISARFKECRKANRLLALNRQNRSKCDGSECCDCLDCADVDLCARKKSCNPDFSCDLPSCELSPCDSGFDLPCDCSF